MRHARAQIFFDVCARFVFSERERKKERGRERGREGKRRKRREESSVKLGLICSVCFSLNEKKKRLWKDRLVSSLARLRSLSWKVFSCFFTRSALSKIRARIVWDPAADKDAPGNRPSQFGLASRSVTSSCDAKWRRLSDVSLEGPPF